MCPVRAFSRESDHTALTGQRRPHGHDAPFATGRSRNRLSLEAGKRQRSQRLWGGARGYRPSPEGDSAMICNGASLLPTFPPNRVERGRAIVFQARPGALWRLPRRSFGGRVVSTVVVEVTRSGAVRPRRPRRLRRQRRRRSAGRGRRRRRAGARCRRPTQQGCSPCSRGRVPGGRRQRRRHRGIHTTNATPDG